MKLRGYAAIVLCPFIRIKAYSNVPRRLETLIVLAKNKPVFTQSVDKSVRHVHEKEPRAWSLTVPAQTDLGKLIYKTTAI